jgi:outer membrane protein OmpA-like peptidoglycan-associated protein
MKSMKFATVMVALTVGLTGCATEDYVNKHFGALDSKVDAKTGELDSKLSATQGQVDAHGAHLGKLDKATQDALDRATAAGKLAEGKFLYAMVLSDDSVKFGADSAKLSPEAQTRLMDFVQKLKSENRNVYLEIQGHTDAVGAETANEKLGQARADAVRLFMNKNGVALNRMSTISYGSTAPIAPNKTKAGRAQNRRVVIIVLA